MKKYVAALAALALTGCVDTGEGDKVGSIVKLSKQGLFCKTYEGEIIRGGFSNGSGVGGTAFHFTVESEELAKKVEHFMNTQQEVKISYRMELATFCRSDSNNVFLTDIEALGKEADRPLEVDTSAAIPVTVIPQEEADTRDAKILKLLKTQQALIEELAATK